MNRRGFLQTLTFGGAGLLVLPKLEVAVPPTEEAPQSRPLKGPLLPPYWDSIFRMELAKLDNPRRLMIRSNYKVDFYRGVYTFSHQPTESEIEYALRVLATDINNIAVKGDATLLVNEGRAFIKRLGSYGTIDADNELATVGAKVLALIP